MLDYLLPLFLVFSFSATSVGALFLAVALAVAAFPFITLKGLCLALLIVLASVWTASGVAALLDRYLGRAFSEPVFFKYGGFLAFGLLLSSPASTDLLIAAIHSAALGDHRLYSALFVTVLGKVVLGTSVVALAILGILASVELPFQWIARGSSVSMQKTIEGLRPFLAFLVVGIVVSSAGGWIVKGLLP